MTEQKVQKKSISKKLRTSWQKVRQKYNDTPHHSFRSTPKVKRRYSLAGLREGWQLIIDSFLFIKQHHKPFLIIIGLYALVSYFLIGGVSQLDYVTFREQANELVQGSLDAVTTSISLFGATVLGGFNQTPSELQQFLSGFLVIVFWLSTVWLVRMLSAGNIVKIRDAFYNGPGSLVGTLGVLAVMVLQLIPAGLGLLAFSVALNDQWISNLAEGLAFAGAALLLCLLSFYWLTGSIIAMMIVALPGMYPFKALASARTLIIGKRWRISARILAVIVIQLLLWIVVLLPIIMLEGWLKFEWLPLVPVVVQLLSAFSLLFSSVYVYKLYRSLL